MVVVTLMLVALGLIILLIHRFLRLPRWILEYRAITYIHSRLLCSRLVVPSCLCKYLSIQNYQSRSGSDSYISIYYQANSIFLSLKLHM